MAEIIGVRFKKVGKTYYFDPKDINFEINQNVIVETSRGVECGEVVIANKHIDDNDIVSPLKPVIRLATDEDMQTVALNKKKEEEAIEICNQKIQKHNLDMHLIDVEYTFDNNKILFYFIAEKRIDFRELVKDLASVFRTRIELRQIGVRDESKILGGLGVCGRPFCCST
ncbi:MAG: regulatory iron-sulfur-containing complex subunit RicT, partial [Oscillospiraceae bacterium]